VKFDNKFNHDGAGRIKKALIIQRLVAFDDPQPSSP